MSPAPLLLAGTEAAALDQESFSAEKEGQQQE
jgi:hypothetical protein